MKRCIANDGGHNFIMNFFCHFVDWLVLGCWVAMCYYGREGLSVNNEKVYCRQWNTILSWKI